MPIHGVGNQDLLNRLGRPKSGLDEIPAGANAQGLKNLLETNWASVARGTNPMVSKSEAAWLVQLGSHPAADDSVKQAILDKVSGMKISDSAKTAGFETFLDGLRGTGGATGTDATTGTGGTPTTDTLDTTGGTTSAGDLGGIPTGTGGGAGNVIDVIAGGGASGTGGATGVAKTNPLRFEGQLTFEGPFRISEDALDRKYNGVKHEHFGTTMLELPGGGVNHVNDMVYDLGDGKVGMHIIPTNDHGQVKDASGNMVDGHVVMDNFLREKMGLGADDPIFALIAYVHPEEHKGDLMKLAKEFVKTEMGSTHMGAYVGEGRTTNAPGTYHHNQWGNSGYPVNVQMVTLKGVDQATLNKTALAIDSVLNHDVQFPPDYKNDKFRTVDLNTTLMFFRDWCKNESYLKDDPSWRTYCAEHKTIVTNAMLNLPLNEASFKETFGAEGAEVWAAFKSKFKEANGRAFTAADETNFEPLWKKSGLNAEDIRPFKDLAAYNAYDSARHAGTLDSFSGQKPLKPGEGMAWAPETTADLMNDFLETYTKVKDVGGPMSVAAMMGFKDTISDRMGISGDQFLGHAGPVAAKMMMADAMIRAEDPGYMRQATGELYVALGGKQDDLMSNPPNPNMQIMGAVTEILKPLKAKLGDILTDPRRPADAAGRKAMADGWLQQAIAPDIAKARQQAVSDPSKTQFYSPPAVSHRVSIGLHESNPFVEIKTLCTAVDSAEVELDAD